jgi:trans-L-3-hydroxyproline dehydratase
MHEPETRFSIELPCGVVEVSCTVQAGRVVSTAFTSVPAFLARRDVAVAVSGHGRVEVDVAYGGAYYAILPASGLGLSFAEAPLETLVAAAAAVTDAVRASVPIAHPEDPELAFLYGTILTDDAAGTAPTANLCVFADRQVDRSPTGSGVTARLARDHARGSIGLAEPRLFFGPTGLSFTGEILGPAQAAATAAVRVRVAGTSSYTGTARFTVETDDPLGFGFDLPTRFADVARDPPFRAG